MEALLECEITYKQIVDAYILYQPDGAVATKAKEDEKNNVEPTDEDIKSLNSKHVRKRLLQGEMVWLRHCGDAGFSIRRCRPGLGGILLAALRLVDRPPVLTLALYAGGRVSFGASG